MVWFLDQGQEKMQLYRLESLRKILLFLQKQEEVKDVVFEEEQYMHVKFDDNFIEHWFYDDLPTPKFYGRCYRLPDDVLYPLDKNWPEYRCEFSRTPDDPDFEQKGKFFLYTPKYIRSYKFCNVRVFLHRFAKALEEEGYIKPWLPQEEIDKVVDILDKQNWAAHKINNKTYKVQPTLARKVRPLILLQDIDMNKYWKRNSIFVTLDLLYRKKWPITRGNLVWHMRRRRQARYHIGHPVGLATIIKEYYPNMPIVDHVNLDWIRTTALICGVPYQISGDGIHITESPTGNEEEIILNDGDCKVMGPRPDNSDFIHLRISRQ